MVINDGFRGGYCIGTIYCIKMIQPNAVLNQCDTARKFCFWVELKTLTNKMKESNFTG
jgi:hypothetical protein